MRRISAHAVVLGSLLAAAGLTQVGSEASNREGQEPAASRGELLANTHCVSCHAFIPPGALTKAGWKPGLLHMAARLGLANELLGIR